LVTICTTGAYIRPSWLTGWKIDRAMNSTDRIDTPMRIGGADRVGGDGDELELLEDQPANQGVDADE